MSDQAYVITLPTGYGVYRGSGITHDRWTTEEAAQEVADIVNLAIKNRQYCFIRFY